MKHLLLALLCSVVVACSGDNQPKPPAPGEIPPCGLDIQDMEQHASVLESISESDLFALTQPKLGADETMQLALQDPTLIGGVPADIGSWPASVYMSTPNSSCSATLVGERVLMSASHCMANKSSVTFSAGANKYTARCDHHPDYKSNSTADLAFCVVDRPITGVTFERLANNMNLRVGDTVRLTGYGCIKPGGGGGNDGIFRIGNASVTKVPNVGVNFDVVTQGGAALCFGDSGGAAYFEYSDGRREIFGINSRGNIKNISYLPAVAISPMQNFAIEWASKNGVQICGINAGARACRDDKGPLPPPKPKWDIEINSKGACFRGKMHPGYESKKDSLLVEMTKWLLNFF